MTRAIAAMALVGILVCAGALADTPSTTGAASLQGGRLDEAVQVKFRDTRLSKVLEVVGTLAGLTIRVPADLDYRVSFEIVDVPARRALQIIAESQSLSYRQEGDTILVERLGAAGK